MGGAGGTVGGAIGAAGGMYSTPGTPASGRTLRWTIDADGRARGRRAMVPKIQ